MTVRHNQPIYTGYKVGWYSIIKVINYQIIFYLDVESYYDDEENNTTITITTIPTIIL